MINSEMNRIWSTFRSELLHFIKAKVNNQMDAEDILQEVFIKIYKHIDDVQDDSKLKPWLYKITKNTIIDFYRKRKSPTVPIETFENIMGDDEESENMSDEIIVCLRIFLDKLPEKYKSPLEMYAFKGMKHRDISEALDISLSGSKTRVQRGREKLREVLSECCHIEFDVYGNVVDYEKKTNQLCTEDSCK